MIKNDIQEVLQDRYFPIEEEIPIKSKLLCHPTFIKKSRLFDSNSGESDNSIFTQLSESFITQLSEVVQLEALQREYLLLKKRIKKLEDTKPITIPLAVQKPEVVRINRLLKLNLKKEIDVIIEKDGNGYIARALDLPLYAFEEDRIDAIDSLKNEIELTYFELNEDDNFSEEWLSIKRFLKEIIIEE